ncbi:MAG: cation transporter [Dehalococcoidia bacterium]|nr:cation transporter [Dehalococcoidia bacterium]
MTTETLYRRGLYLEYITIAYNVLEAVFSILFGALAGSIALIGFGLDSIIESMSAFVLLWRLRKHQDLSQEAEEKIERRAQRFIAITFFVLGAYVAFEAVRKLATGDASEASLPGIIIAAASIVSMPVLWHFKYKTGKQINSKALIADSKETLACGFLSVALLIGLGANYLFGFWQADPIAGLIITVFLFREGWEGWTEVGEKESGSD